MCDCFFSEEKPDTPRCQRNGKPHYFRYRAMIERCYKPDVKDYPSYGARGIKVCLEWLMDFMTFVNDVGDIPEGMTLDRTNNDLGYCKHNFRWATRTTQNKNRRDFKRAKSDLPKGIYQSKTHYFSQIKFENKVHYVGSSKDLNEVVKMHKEYYFNLHGENP